MMFQAPLDPWVPVSSPYGYRQSTGTMHYGIDWASPVGMPVYCAEQGHIRYKANEGGGYGNTLTAQHIDGWESRYAHLSSFAVNQGDPVVRGQVLGFSGGAAGSPGAGSSTGPHLHHELRQHGTAVDPYPLLTWGIPGQGWSDDMTDEQMAQLGQWLQEQTAVVLDTLVGAGWRGHTNILGQWEQDTRAVVNAHTTAAVEGGATATAAAVEAVEVATPTELEPVGTDDGLDVDWDADRQS